MDDISQLSFFDLDERETIEYKSTKYQCILNKLVNIKIKENDFFKNYVIININPKGLKTNNEKYSYSYRNIFNKDKDFYRKYLLSVTIKAGNNMFILFEGKNKSIDFKQKLVNDCDRRDDFIFSNINFIDKESYHTFFNLLLKATIKMKYKDSKWIINDSYEYIIKFKDSKNEENIKTFLPYFVRDYNEKKEYSVYIDYRVKNLKKIDLKDEDRKIQSHNVYGEFNEDIYTHYDKENHNKAYVFEQINRTKRQSAKDVILATPKKASLNAACETMLEGSKQMLMHKVLNDIDDCFGDYVSYDFLTLNKEDYKEIPEDLEKEKRKSNKLLIESILKNKTLAIIDNIQTDLSKMYVSYIYRFCQNIGMIPKNYSNKEKVYKEINNIDFIINITYDKDYYDKDGRIDDYLIHDDITPTKNINIESDKKDKEISDDKKDRMENLKEPGLNQQIRGMLFSLIVEEDIIKNKKSKLLAKSNYPDNIIFAKYRGVRDGKNKKELYTFLTLKENGDFSLNAISSDYFDEIKEKRLDTLDEKLHTIKELIETNKNSKDKKTIDYNDELFIVVDDNINKFRKLYLRPLISKRAYKDILFFDKEYYMKNEKNKKYPRVLTETKKGKTKYGITQKSKEVWNYMHYGFFNIKRIGNLYISGYTDNPQSSLPNSPRARKVIGENADLLTNKFIDEQYNEYKITGNRNGVHPVAYKYLQMLENEIIEE